MQIAALLTLGGCFPKGWPPKPAAISPADARLFDVGPYLLMSKSGEPTVVIEHALSQAPTVRWRSVAQTSSLSASRGEVVATQVDDLWYAILPGLPPDQPLLYQVESEIGATTQIPFRAGRSRGTPFSFAAFGDTRTGHKIHSALINAMAKEPVEFVVHSGDLVETGGVKEQWQQFFRIEEPVIARSPLFAVVGNHDDSPRRHFSHYFLSGPLAESNRYYYQDWGDVRVVVVDSEIEARAGSEQYEFLDRVLKEGAQQGMIMLLALHYPPYSSGAHGSNIELREVIGDLAPKYGVEVVLAGHDHDYERTKRIDGVTYMVAASGGAPIRRLKPSWFTAVVRTEPHFVIFNVDRGSLVGRAINLGGETFDSFVIPPNPARVDL